MKTSTKFTYDSYHSIRNIDIFDIPVEVLITSDYKRYIRILKENGINTIADLATADITCSLGSCQGLGKKVFSILKDFLDHLVTYKEMYDKIQSNINHTDVRCGISDSSFLRLRMHS